MSDHYRDLLLPILTSSRYRAAVHGYAKLSGVEVEEFIQMVALRAWEHRHQYDPEGGTPWGWLRVVSRNLAISRAAYERRRATSRYREDDHGDDPDYEGQLDHLHTLKGLGSAIEGLPDHLRSAVHVRYWEELGLRDCAIAVGAGSAGTMMSRTYRARAALREALLADERIDEHINGAA